MKWKIIIFYFVGLFFEQASYAQSSKSVSPTSQGISITIDQAQVQKSFIAMPAFQGLPSPVGRTLYNTIHHNLDTSIFFQMIKSSAFLEDTKNMALTPYPQNPNGFRFNNWQQISAEFLILGTASLSNNRLYFETYVYHVSNRRLIFRRTYQTTGAKARWLAHTFSNDLFKVITGNEGMFLSQVVVSSDRGGGRWREIYTMDWDGHNIKRRTRHRSISTSPSWSSDGKSIAYSTYNIHRRKGRKFTNLDLVHLDISSGQRRILSAREGMNSGSVFHPRGRFLYLTFTTKGNSDIFRIALAGTEGLKQITKGPYRAMNVEPAMSPDGRKIVFSSDRSGRPMIYIMNADGSGVRRLTFAGYYNSSPTWSPDGKWIAFSGGDRGHYDIFIIKPDGTGLKRLTSAKKPNGRGANNEEPTFSPDSKHILFTSDRTRKKQLYIIGIDGSKEQRITFDRHNYYKPKWGDHKSQ